MISVIMITEIDDSVIVTWKTLPGPYFSSVHRLLKYVSNLIPESHSQCLFPRKYLRDSTAILWIQ